VAEEVEEAEKLLSRQRIQRLRESLAFRSLEFMVEFLVFLVQPQIWSCCNRGVEGKRWKSWVLDCGGGRLRWSGGWDGVAVDVR
jgi:hypothetical protein